jgi:hypothetical protein
MLNRRIWDFPVTVRRVKSFVQNALRGKHTAAMPTAIIAALLKFFDK